MKVGKKIKIKNNIFKGIKFVPIKKKLIGTFYIFIIYKLINDIKIIFTI